MHINSSQSYESQLIPDTITEQQITKFIDNIAQKMQHPVFKDQDMNENLYARLVEQIDGYEKDRGARGDGYGMVEEKKRRKLSHGDGEKRKEQNRRSYEGLCQLCSQDIKMATIAIREYCCRLCGKYFCEMCLGRFRVLGQSQKQERKKQEWEEKKEGQVQAVPTCADCDRRYLYGLIQGEDDREFQIRRRAFEKIKSTDSLPNGHPSPNPRKNSLQPPQSLPSLKNKTLTLILQTTKLTQLLAQTHSRIQYGHKIHQSLQQKYAKLQLKKLNQSNRMKPACPWESEKANSEADVLKDSGLESVLEDQSRLVSQGRCCRVGCVIM